MAQRDYLVESGLVQVKASVIPDDLD